ncbi:MAG TPA: DUF6763 family protein [Steroidobacteraceae bacterium]|jgi:hypothetical protein
MNGPKVRVGDWYLDRDQHDFLYVIDVDEEEGVIDVRDEYGDIDEIDFAEWETKNLVLCSTPREWKETEDDELGGD